MMGQKVQKFVEVKLSFVVITGLPVDEGPFSKHEVKLVVEPRPGLHDGRRI